ncbi:MAG: zinc transporter ZupT, partial [Bacteroidales bacterium]|nr:zinc transporter ZupT [Bacteroidales bacterium]
MFEGNFIIALLLTLFAGMATGIGGAIIMFVKKFSPKYLCATLGFSAGVMILISLVELFQEAREALSLQFGDKLGLLYTLLSFFGGMAIIALIDNFVPKENNPHEVNSMNI